MAIDTADGHLHGVLGSVRVGPTMDLAAVRGGGAEPIACEGPKTVLRWRLDAGAPFPQPAVVTLDFHSERLERCTIHSAEPPIARNPRWWRREDEDERRRHHDAWLRAEGVATGWFSWGELVSSYNSGARISAIRLRYRFEGEPWNPSPETTLSIPVRPADRFDAASGTLTFAGEATLLRPGLTDSEFLPSTSGQRSHRFTVAPGRLMDDLAVVDVTFHDGRLQSVAFCPRSEAFGASWNDHGPDEAATLTSCLRDWLIAAAGSDSVNADWGDATVHVDQISGTQQIRLRFR